MDYKPWMDLIKPEDMPNDDLKFIAESAGITCQSGINSQSLNITSLL